MNGSHRTESGTSATVALALDWLARLPSWSVAVPGADGEFDRALALVGVAHDARTVLRAGHGLALLGGSAGVLGLAAVLAVGAAVPWPVRVAAAVVVVGSLALPVAVPRLVWWLADARRASALGAVPALVSRAVLRMRVAPSAEAAAAFAARTGDGPLAADLERRVGRAQRGPGSGFGAFGEAWGDRFPALRRAVLLVEAAGDAPPGERDRCLDRAMAAVLDGTRDRAAEFAAGLRGPATALYAFGVLLPLALVAVLPAARVAVLPVSLPVVVAVYDVALPLALLAASAWLLARRPSAFPAPRVPVDHPDIPATRRLAPLVAVGAAVAAWVVAPLVLPGWTRPLAAVGVGLGTGLVAWYRPVVRVHERVRAVEHGLPDALFLVGRRVRDGHAVETAVERASGEVDGPTGDVFTAATRRGRQLRVGVREAFLGEHGALADVPSPRARSTADLLGTAAREGRPAGRAVVAMADHLEDLYGVEREARREVRRVTATLSNTAAVFGPLVGGVTVALADAMGGRTLGTGTPSALPTADLGLAVGAYVLALSAVLAALATGLERDLDPGLVGYRVGLALLAATAVYLAGFAGASLLT